LKRLYACLLERAITAEDLDLAEQALDVIVGAVEGLHRSLFIYRKAGADPFLGGTAHSVRQQRLRGAVRDRGCLDRHDPRGAAPARGRLSLKRRRPHQPAARVRVLRTGDRCPVAAWVRGDHIPGAVNLPVVGDWEFAEAGIRHKTARTAPA